MPFLQRLAIPLALLAVVACDGATTEDARAPLVLTAADLQVLDTSDSLAVVEDLAVLDDGTVWVQNSIEPRFLAFDISEGLVAAHGRNGGGPEEWSAPAGFVAGGWEGQAWTLDRRRQVLARTSWSEGPRAELPLPSDAIPPGSIMGGLGYMSPLVRTARLGDELIVPRRHALDEVPATRFWTTFWNADLVALDPGTGQVRILVSLPEVMGDLDAHFAAVSTGFPPFPFWYRLWAVCGDEIRLHDFVRNELRGFDSDGIELDPVRLPPPPFTEVTPRELVRAVFDLIAAERAGALTDDVGSMSPDDSTRLINDAAARLDGRPEQHAAILPPYVDFRCEDDGTMWLRPMDLEAGGMAGSATWLRIDRDGGVRQVTFPERFEPYRFTDRRVWGVVRDELDVAAVGWIEVPGN